MAETVVRAGSNEGDPSLQITRRVQEQQDVDEGIGKAPRALISSVLSAQNIRISVYFLVWLVLSVVYNHCNKKVVNALGMPWFVGSCQLFIGIPFICLNWATGLRPVPNIANKKLVFVLSMLSILHCGAHLCGVSSLQLGAVSFTHIVKACEPVFTAVFSMVFLGTFYAWQVYGTLVGVVVGVSIASASELNLEVLALVFALGSATFAALRGIFAKKALKDVSADRKLKAQNLYYILTIFSSFLVVVPLCLIEIPEFSAKFQLGIDTVGRYEIYHNLIVSGLAFYFYNEAAFLALEAVSPVTHAVGSTFKRVFIIVWSVIYFKNPITALGWTGAAIAIVSVFLYSLAKMKYTTPTVDPKIVESKP